MGTTVSINVKPVSDDAALVKTLRIESDAVELRTRTLVNSYSRHGLVYLPRKDTVLKCYIRNANVSHDDQRIRRAFVESKNVSANCAFDRHVGHAHFFEQGTFDEVDVGFKGDVARINVCDRKVSDA